MFGSGHPACFGSRITRVFESHHLDSLWHPREDADNPIIANMDNYSVRENRVVLIRTIINTIIYIVSLNNHQINSTINPTTFNL